MATTSTTQLLFYDGTTDAHDHINLVGNYDFDQGQRYSLDKLRPLQICDRLNREHDQAKKRVSCTLKIISRDND